MDSDTKSRAFGTIKTARDLIKVLPSASASPTTLQSYEREISRLIAKNHTRSPSDLWMAICDTQKVRTYYKRIAAARHFILSNLQLALRQQDRQQRAQDEGGWISTVRVIERLVELDQIIEKSAGKCPIADPIKRHSKRQDIRGLPDDWREQMHDAMKTSKYKVDFLVAAVTGCRPHELQYGVQVRLDSALITFTITGAKVKAQQGQPERTIEYSANSAHPLVKALVEEMRSQQAEIAIVKVESKENFTSSIRRYAKKLWPCRRAELTPYCLRHAAASDFKRHLSPEDVSRALGHAVDATASIYGQRQMSSSRGGLQPAAVRAARIIKATCSTKPFLASIRSM